MVNVGLADADVSDMLDVSVARQGQVVSSALAAPFAELNDEIAELQRKRLGQLHASVHCIASIKEKQSESFEIKYIKISKDMEI
jgi:hypothetical protein